MTLNDELRVRCVARCGRSVGDVLREARAHIGGGWVEPMSTDAAGRLCAPTDEGITNFCVADAVALAAGLDAELSTFATTALLDALPSPGVAGLTQWLEVEGRTKTEVAQLFGRAIARLRVKEAP
jgi:hypothetical protein